MRKENHIEKFKKELLVYYTLIEKAFIDFFELKCNILVNNEKKQVAVREDLYPENVMSILSFYDNGHITFEIFFDTKFGEYFVPLTICLHSGHVSVEFGSNIILGTEDEGYVEEELNEKQFNSVVKTCIPLIESFLEKLIKIKRNHPCMDSCSFYNKKMKDGKCDEIYLQKKEIVSKKSKK